MAKYVTCVDSGGSPSVAPCADAGGIAYVPVMTDVPPVQAVNFDNANQLFAYGFAAVLAFWAIGVCVGAILSLIRKGE